MSNLAPLDSTPTLLTDRAYEAIKSAILRLELKPGQTVSESELAAALNTSKTPVREALRRLSHSGLILSTPYKGYKVSELDVNDLDEIMALRGVLEGLAVREASSRLTTTELDALFVQLAKSEEMFRAGDSAKASEIGHVIHIQIQRGAGNGRLLEALTKLNDQFDRVRILSARMPDRLPASLKEHQEIIEAIRDRDGGSAESLMRRHLANVHNDVRKDQLFQGRSYRSQ